LIRILVSAGVVACLVRASEYFDAGMPYVAELSSNPTPSEAAKAMGPHMMHKAQLFFFFAVAGAVILVASIFIGKRRRR
jgi:hypothetical protein